MTIAILIDDLGRYLVERRYPERQVGPLGLRQLALARQRPARDLNARAQARSSADAPSAGISQAAADRLSGRHRSSPCPRPWPSPRGLTICAPSPAQTH